MNLYIANNYLYKQIFISIIKLGEKKTKREMILIIKITFLTSLSFLNLLFFLIIEELKQSVIKEPNEPFYHNFYQTRTRKLKFFHFF